MQNQEYSEMRKLKKLKKIKKEESYSSEEDAENDYDKNDDFIDDDDESYYSDTQRKKEKYLVDDRKERQRIIDQNQKKNKRLQKKIQQKAKQNPDFEEEDYPIKSESEINLIPDNEEIFDPQDLIDNYRTLEDQQIVNLDQPERLQLRFQSIPKSEDLIDETNWLTWLIIQENNLKEEQCKDLAQKVHKTLEFLKLDHYEIMFIWQYKRNQIQSQKKFIQKDEGDGVYENIYDTSQYELTLRDLWNIYQKDIEWQDISQKKNKCKILLESICQILNMPLQQKELLLKTNDQKGIEYLYEYLIHQCKKLKTQDEINNLLGIKKKYKQRMNLYFPREIFKLNLENTIFSTTLTTFKFAENIIQNSSFHKPIPLNVSVVDLIQKFTNQSINYLQDNDTTSNCFVQYIAQEYFHYPFIRNFLKGLYKKEVVINTRPTQNGKNLTVYDYYYVVKRIQNKRPINLNLELWLLIKEAEEKKLIEVEFDCESKGKFYSIMKSIKELLMPESQQRKYEDSEWNVFREAILEKLFYNFIKPKFEQEIKDELTDSALKIVTQKSGELFKKLIEIKPYKYQQYIKVLSFSLDEQENVLAGLINETGHLHDSLILKNILTKPKNTDFTQKRLHEQDIDDLQNFIKEYQPSILIISPKNMKMQYLKANLLKFIDEIFQTGPKPFVIFSNIKIPPIFAKSNISNKYLKDFSIAFKELISAARYLQSPLAETLNLWSENTEDNALLKINFHPSQSQISPKKLQNHFELIILEVVNKYGVDINTCIKYDHLSSPLQFISGLGPRKSKYLLLDIKKKNSDNIILRREELKKYLGEIVYRNSIGFIKINEMLQIEYINRYKDYEHTWLDFTKIHPDQYSLTYELVQNILENNQIDINQKVFEILKQKNKEFINKQIDELCVNEFAENKSIKIQEMNMIYFVSFIISELLNPFQDDRKEYSTKSDQEEIFYALTEESPNNLKEESLLTVKIFSVDERQIKVLTNNGVMGIVMSQDVFEEGINYSEEEVLKKYQIGDYVKAKVKKLNFESVKILFTLKQDALRNHKDYLSRNKIFDKYDLKDDNSFVIIVEEDYPIIQMEGKASLNRFKNRKINHPYFKNIGFQMAQQYLEDKQDGSFVFRPSNKGNDYLNLTWKFYDEVLVHHLIKEGFKSSKDAISSQLIMNDDQFESIDEIIENYIKPCNNQVQDIKKFNKFSTDKIKDVISDLQMKKSQNSKMIPYCFSFAKEKPQFLILSYIPEGISLKHECIKIKPDGLHFHGQTFSKLSLIQKYFKDNFKKQNYQSYLQSSQVEFNQKRTKIAVMDDIKQEDRRRYDGRYNKNYSRRDRDDRRGRRDYNRSDYNRDDNRGDFERRKMIKKEYRDRREYDDRDSRRYEQRDRQYVKNEEMNFQQNQQNENSYYQQQYSNYQQQEYQQNATPMRTQNQQNYQNEETNLKFEYQQIYQYQSCIIKKKLYLILKIMFVVQIVKIVIYLLIQLTLHFLSKFQIKLNFYLIKI